MTILTPGSVSGAGFKKGQQGWVSKVAPSCLPAGMWPVLRATRRPRESQGVADAGAEGCICRGATQPWLLPCCRSPAQRGDAPSNGRTGPVGGCCNPLPFSCPLLFLSCSQVPFAGGGLYCLTVACFTEGNPALSWDAAAECRAFTSWLRHKYSVLPLSQAAPCACSG